MTRRWTRRLWVIVGGGPLAIGAAACAGDGFLLSEDGGRDAKDAGSDAKATKRDAQADDARSADAHVDARAENDARAHIDAEVDADLDSSGDGQVACSPGGLRCGTDGVSVQSCDNSGQWSTTGTCPFVCSGAGQCSGVCMPGSAQCNGLTPQTCVAGQWQNGSDCPDMCTAGKCIGVCMPGASQCCRTGESCEPSTSGAGAFPETCDDSGQWSAGITCPSVCPILGGAYLWPQCMPCNGVATCAVYNGTDCVCP
jgi:hypothetical protein